MADIARDGDDLGRDNPRSVTKFSNTELYGIRDDGHIYGIIALYEAFVDGRVSEEQWYLAEDHFLECESCGNIYSTTCKRDFG